ncbi:hypothetical protein BD779DRAFT_1680443 [Infundibulicybe gibba]|nr:hypothetical protein BD779DRAFT_1680443 [Infundibulicybe gibba]
MPQHIAMDPANEVCPDFSLPIYDLARDSMIANPGCPQIQTHEEAAKALAGAWATDNAERCKQYARQFDAQEDNNPPPGADLGRPPQQRQETPRHEPSPRAAQRREPEHEDQPAQPPK